MISRLRRSNDGKPVGFVVIHALMWVSPPIQTAPLSNVNLPKAETRYLVANTVSGLSSRRSEIISLELCHDLARDNYATSLNCCLSTHFHRCVVIISDHVVIAIFLTNVARFFASHLSDFFSGSILRRQRVTREIIDGNCRDCRYLRDSTNFLFEGDCLRNYR